MKFLDEHGKEYNMPNRKTYNNKFGNWKNVLHKCGFDDKIKNQNYVIDNDGNYVLQHDNKDFLQKLVLEYIDVNSTIPTMKELEKYYGTSLKTVMNKHFGGFNGCLESLNIKINQKFEYTQEELDNAFLGFVEEFSRVPSIRDLTKVADLHFGVIKIGMVVGQKHVFIMGLSQTTENHIIIWMMENVAIVVLNMIFLHG